jgi:peptidoglycan/LPS O-acetylase OafA/YrhL
MEPKKYAYIDSLRGIAILLVILAHVGQISYLTKVTHGIKTKLSMMGN